MSARHERGVGLVYGAALAGWTYLFVWGALRALDVGGARKIGAVVGIVVGARSWWRSSASSAPGGYVT